MSKKTTTKNTSATEKPVNPADVLAAGAAQAASQASTPEGPATQPVGNVENLPPVGDTEVAAAKLPALAVESVIVTSEVDGFRRAGRAWSRTPTTVPFGELSEADLVALEREPLLQVVYVAAGKEKQAG